MRLRISPDVLPGPEAVSGPWLTDVLRASGVLTGGRVADVVVETRAAKWSTSSRFAVTYEPGATGRRPRALFLKLCQGAQAVFGASEVHYYARDYVGLPDAPMPRCFHAGYSASPPGYHLLLEDVSATHTSSVLRWPAPRNVRAVMRALARLHVHHEGTRRRLADDTDAGTADAQIGRYFAETAKGLPRLRETLGRDLAPEHDDRLTALFEDGPARFRARALEPEGMTLVHGDLNPGNVMLARDPDGPALFIDRQPFAWSLETWVGASDLAMWMVPYWPRDVRRDLEALALSTYAEALSDLGRPYPLSRIERDYALGVEQALAYAVSFLKDPTYAVRSRPFWTRFLRRALAAL